MRWRIAMARWRRWSNAGAPPKRRATPRWRPSEMRVTRAARSMSRPRRWSGSKRNAKALANVWRDLDPVLEAARKPLPRPSNRLRRCPIRRHWRSTSKARRGRGNRGVGGCRQARRSRDQGARDRRRPRATEHRGARAGRVAQARRRGRAATCQAIERQKQLAAERSELEHEPAELDPAIARTRARQQ